MHETNLSRIDLNLLVILEALLSEAHVGRAGVRVCLSQPATSHALARLRTILGDPLLVRSGARMVLTPRAEALRAPVSKFIAAARNVLTTEHFDPATSNRRFRFMLPDFVFHLLMPPLTRRLQREAPGITIEGISWRGPDLLPTPASNDVDFIVTTLSRDWPGYERHPLYGDRDVVAVRTGHPDRDNLASREGLSASRHVSVVGAGERADILDEWIAAAGITRDVAVVAPNYLAALSIVAATDLVAIVPGKIVACMASQFGLELIPLPIDPGQDSYELLSLIRSRSDQATTWMRERISETAAAL